MTDWPNSEIPLPAARVQALAEAHGPLADHVTADPLSEEAQAQFRPHLVRALQAAAELTPQQLKIFTRFVAGWTQVETAAALGISQPTVHEALYGKKKNGVVIGGILKRIAQNVGVDPALLPARADAQPEEVGPDINVAMAGWFEKTKGNPAMVGPMMVLFWIWRLVDSKRQVRTGDLYRVLGAQTVTMVIPTLKYGGWVLSDGVTVTLLKIPIGEVP